MVYYAVIDTNVLISAMLKWNSVPGNVLEFTFSGTIVPVLNEHIVREYREVLSRPKFKFPKDIIDTIVSEIERLGIYIDAPELEVELPDPKDRVFYEVVMEERNTEDAYLVTGNLKHFPEEPFVVTPRQMIDIIVGNMEE
ncbi:MAG: putative toxin-antitoxin system toxin component, PIN family [Clostridia bacterium]|jgi:putative PIN family toxin of toxin-antitoxin system|nr:putative toxin-antitoxin system toxin component, PIN family [Clostridia bacterium]